MNLNRKQKTTLMHVVGYTVIAGIAFGIAYPIFGLGRDDARIGGTQKVSFLSNIPSWFDKSFNEITYDGVARYTAYTDQKMGTRGADYTDDGTSYVDPIRSLYRNGAETIVSAGFTVAGMDWETGNHSGAYQVLSEEVSTDKNFVLIDENAHTSGVDDFYGNTIGIMFSANEAGFFAGLASAVWAADQALNDPSYVAGDDIYFGLWGGDRYGTVFDWMSGYEQAVNYFNHEYLGYTINSPVVDNEAAQFSGSGLGKMKLTQGSSVLLDIDYSTEATSKIDASWEDAGVYSWYTGGFTSDGSEGAAADDKTNNMINQGVDVIFPIAGEQTHNALNQVVSRNKITQIIGVDVDLTQSANEQTHDNILGSALKNVQAAAELGTWYMDTYLQEYANDDWTPKDNIDSLAKNDDYYQGRGENFIWDNETQGENSNSWGMETYAKGADPTVGEEGEVKAATFMGTFENNAVGFVDTATQLIDAVTSLGIEGIDTFEELMLEAYEAQTQSGSVVIEAQSYTFALETPHSDDNHAGHGIWMPDWSVYNRG